VDADGFDWLLTTEGLMAISAGGTVTNFQIPLPAANDMTLGPDGDLYITNTGENAIMQCTITTTPSASCATTIPVPSSFTSAAPESITSAGGDLWFTTSLGELGSLSPTGTVGGPYDEHPATFSDGPAGPDANLLAEAPDGTLWTTAVARDDATDAQLVHVNASTGAVIARYGTRAGLPGDANIIGLTVGPDANVWFVDAGGAGAIGVLDVADGRVTEWPFPRGYGVAPVIPSGIAAGPDDSIWFSAVTTADNPAIGEITGLAQADVSISRTVRAAGGRSASLRVGCSGPSGAGCEGTLTVTAAVTAPKRTVTLGAGRYNVPAGHSATATVPLSGAARRLLTAAPGHRLAAAVTVTPQVGSPRRFTISVRS
jgi:streptogramin lyase